MRLPGGQVLAMLGVVAVCCCLCLMAFVANCVTQIKHGQIYIPPKELVDIIKLVFGAATTVLTAGFISEYKRKAITGKRDDGQSKNDKS